MVIQMDLKAEIKKIVGFTDLVKGENFPKKNIVNPKQIPFRGGTKLYTFKVRSETSSKIYSVQMILKERKMMSATCTCPKYEKESKCKHIAAVLLEYGNRIFGFSEDTQKFLIAQKILDECTPSIYHNFAKQKLTLTLELQFVDSYYGVGLFVKPKIGLERIYVIGAKISEFFRIYREQSGSCYFGKQFTYQPSMQYFDAKDEEILLFLQKCYKEEGHYYGGQIFIREDKIHPFLLFLKERRYEIMHYGTFVGVAFENPFQGKLTKKNTIYTYQIQHDFSYHPLTRNFQYIIKNQILYEVPDAFLKVLNTFRKYNVEKIEFRKQELDKFVKGILPTIKNNIQMDASLQKEVSLIDPIPKIYLDIEDEKIICKVDFDYHGDVVHYFKYDDYNIIRNEEFEQNVINDILKYSFQWKDTHLEISEMEQLGNFLEIGMNQLSSKYDIFTSEKLKNTKIVKKTRITSQFSIGQDHIMSYTFDLGDITPEEMTHIFDTIRNHKKYYKLKSGAILDVDDNQNLKEFQSLMEQMDFTTYDLKEGGGNIPKYRAIYLDSLRKHSSVIQTDHLFDQLIQDFNTYKDAPIHLSKIEEKILRSYQLIGVKWLYNIYKCGFGGILADEMGLGKSIQMIYFLKQVIKDKKDAKILIVAPTSLIYNWENEFKKFGENLYYQVLAENQKKRKEILQNLDDIHILITTYGLVKRDIEYYSNIPFELIILDEAQSIKNPGSNITKTVKSLKSNVNFALTGTPIENSIIELWSIFDFIMPGYLTSLPRFQSKYNLKDFDTENQPFDCLQTQISPFILRRKKTDVAKDLPPKIENTIYLELSKEQKALYVHCLQKTNEEMQQLIEKEGFQKARFKILQLLTRLRQICIDPKILFPEYQGISTKVEELTKMVMDITQNGHKILIFTSFKTALEIVRERLNQNGIDSYVIDGSVSSKKRAELVEKFNHDYTKVFLIMLKAGGTGLNLTGADVVIHLDLWWNPQAENQATDRAHRIGQSSTVQVIKMVCIGTIEEKILQLQKQKKLLSDTLIEGNKMKENQFSNLSEQDIQNLLSYDVDSV